MNNMNPVVTRELARRFRDQHGVASRSQLLALGVSRALLARRLRSGEWEPVGRRVVRLAGSQPTTEQQLLGYCLAAGPSAVASHHSAAWLWKLAAPPSRHHLTVGRTSSARGAGAYVHKPRVFPYEVSIVRHIPCTSPLRTILDLAGTCSPEQLEQVVDRAIADKLVSTEALDAELARAARQGLSGVDALRRELEWRRPLDLQQMSVLEAKVLRLLEQGGIRPAGVEVKMEGDLGYRLDILMSPGLAVEVDGYAFHHSLEQMSEDARRRNRLQARGVQFLLYTWKDVTEDSHRVLAEVRHAVARTSARSAGA